MSEHADNRREFSRSYVEMGAEVQTPDGNHIRGLARDVSLSGLFFITDSDIPLGSAVKATIMLGDGLVPVDVMGEISRKAQDGVGIHITELEPAAAEHMKKLVMYNASDVEQVEDEFDTHAGLKPRVAH